MDERPNTYRQIVRSSSIMGGAQVTNYGLGLLRMKAVAVLLGPAGLGVVTLYTTALQLVGTVSGLGIGSSGVRDIVEAYAQADEARASRTVRILRRMCWLTGILGWMIAVVLAKPISTWLIGSPGHAPAIRILGVTLVMGSVTGGQLALLQGLRRIGDLARANVYGVVASSVLAIGLYAWLGRAGIVPVLLATPLVTLACSHWFARRIKIARVAVSWADTFRGARKMTVLGGAMMSSSLLAVGIDMLTRSLIAHRFGVGQVGIYQSAWAISGMFAGFVLSAMGTDFYPRLTATIDDHQSAVRAVNEQLEVGILLALPGLLATLAFAPAVMQLVYSREFLAGAALLPWMVLGVFGRVLSWPLGYIQLATGDSRMFFACELIFAVLWAILLPWMIDRFGIIGAAYTFAGVYALHVPAMMWVGHGLINFTPTRHVLQLAGAATAFVAAGMCVHLLIKPGVLAMAAGAIIMLGGSIISLRELALRVGADHRLAKLTRLTALFRVNTGSA